MANVVELVLSPELMAVLQKEHLVTIATTDFETKSPNVNAISWVYAMDEKRVRFAVDQRSRIVSNIEGHSGVVITIIAGESVYSIHGTASIITTKMEDVPLKLTLVEIVVEAVRDVMFYGSKISQEPTYEKTYDLNAAKKLDNQVLQAMKEA